MMIVLMMMMMMMMMMMINLQAAIHCVYCDSDSQRSHKSDIPSAEGTESLIPYLVQRQNSLKTNSAGWW